MVVATMSIRERQSPNISDRALDSKPPPTAGGKLHPQPAADNVKRFFTRRVDTARQSDSCWLYELSAELTAIPCIPRVDSCKLSYNTGSAVIDLDFCRGERKVRPNDAGANRQA